MHYIFCFQKSPWIFFSITGFFIYFISNSRKFDNIYIGYGVKYNSENYSPPAPPAAQEEYSSGPEITEAEDPTVEQERSLAAAQQEAMDNDEEDDESEDFDDDDWTIFHKNKQNQNKNDKK